MAKKGFLGRDTSNVQEPETVPTGAYDMQITHAVLKEVETENGTRNVLDVRCKHNGADFQKACQVNIGIFLADEDSTPEQADSSDLQLGRLQAAFDLPAELDMPTLNEPIQDFIGKRGIVYVQETTAKDGTTVVNRGYAPKLPKA